MKKRMLSLICVLALCLGLLPATTLAAGEDAPAKLYVGDQQVSVAETVTYWSTNDSGELTRVENATDNSSNWNVKYDPYTATLTLNEAKISGSYNQYNNPFTAGIYAKGSSNQSVALTIELIGTNTITGSYGIYVEAQQGEVVGTNASLLIQNSGDDGSLEVSGSSYGIYVKSGTGNASLTIKDASVVASSSSTLDGYAGVCVQSSSDATSSPQLSLAVNGGSLTTSASEGNDGIQFYVGAYGATSATTSLSVTNNAIVDARTGGISASGVSVNPNVNIGSTGSSGGIVWNGAEGTVYGEVELQKDLEIKSGETLTIPEGSSLNANGKLTNDGTINVENGGRVSGNLSGDTPLTTPSISQQPQSTTVTEGSTAEFSITASAAETYQWQQKTAASESDWTDISSATDDSYTISSTTTDRNGYQYRCVVTSASGVSVTSAAATLTVNAATVPVTGVKLDQTELSLYTGESKTLIATVQPSDATTKAVTWSSSDNTIATVEDGTVTAVKAGEATITVTTVDGSKQAACTVTVTEPVYKMTTNPTALDFGSVYIGYAQPAAQTVTITNTGNQTQTLTQPVSSTGNFEVGTLSKMTLSAGEVATFTVQPKAGLAVGTYSESIAVASSEGATVTIPASFTVMRYSSGGSSTPSKTPSQQAVDKIENARNGSTVEITLRTGQTTLDKEVFEELAGRDVTLEISLSNGVTWTVNGQDIPENAKLSDLNLGVTLDASTIPVSVINTVTGAVDTIQIALKHDGAFGFTMTLSAPLGKTNAGYWANLYYYNTRTRTLEFQAADRIASDGTASFPFDHASDYAIVIDDKSHEPVELPFTDVPADYWAHSEIAWAYENGYVNGSTATTFNPGGTVTRQQVWMILARMSGAKPADMAAAKAWAVANGISDGTNPGAPVTRQQLAALLYRYAMLFGYDVSVGESTNILSYTDVGQLSEYAIPAMQWACGAGIIRGSGDGSTLSPLGASTRAQLAVMLYRFMES